MKKTDFLKERSGKNAIEKKTTTAKEKEKRFEKLKNATKWSKNPDCQTLHDAVARGDLEEVENLLKQGYDAMRADELNRSPLHVAAAYKHADIVRLLIQYGADVNVQDINKNTPLHLAVIGNRLDIVNLLLKAGADLKANDIFKNTPIDLAKNRLSLLRNRILARENEEFDQEVQQMIDFLNAYSSRLGDKLVNEQLCAQIASLSTQHQNEIGTNDHNNKNSKNNSEEIKQQTLDTLSEALNALNFILSSNVEKEA